MRLRQEQGYTLIEALIVMTIISILGLVSYTLYSGSQDGAQFNRAKDNLLTSYHASNRIYDDNNNFHSTTDLIERLHESEPEASYQTALSNLNNDPHRVYVQVQGQDDVTMCVQSKPGRTYCIRGAHGEGIAIKNDKVTPAVTGYTHEAKSYAATAAGAYAKITANPLLFSQLGWSPADDAPELNSTGGTPTVRLICDDLNTNTDPDARCPHLETSRDDAYFEWTLSTDDLAPDTVVCKLDNTIVACDETGINTANHHGKKLFTSLAFGAHTFQISAKNDSGTAKTEYTWTILPGLPQVRLTLADPTLDTSGETKQRSARLTWTAVQPIDNSGQSTGTGALEEVYCKVEVPKADGSYTTLSDAVCANQTIADARHRSGTVILPGPLPYHNSKPQRVTVTAINEAGASDFDVQQWLIVDHTPPTTTTISDPIIDPPTSDPINVTNGADGSGQVCYSPVVQSNLAAIGQSTRFYVQASGNDPESGLHEIAFPNIGTLYLGSGGSGVDGPASITNPYEQAIDHPTADPQNGVIYNSSQARVNMYRFGVFSGGIPTAPATYYIVVHNGAPGDYPGVNVPFRLIPDNDAPFTPANNYTGGGSSAPGNGNPGAWSAANSVTFTASGAGDTGCAGFNRYQYRISYNDGAWSGWVDGGSYTATAEGQTAVQFREVDKTENTSPASVTQYANLDRTAPPAPGATSTNNGSWTNDAVTISRVAVTDVNAPYSSGVNNYQVNVALRGADDANGVKNSITVSGAADEGHTQAQFLACDTVGNCSAYGGLANAYYDISPPTVGKPSAANCGGENDPGQGAISGFVSGCSDVDSTINWTASVTNSNPNGANAISPIANGQGRDCRWGDTGGRNSSDCTPSGVVGDSAATNGVQFKSVCGIDVYYACSVGDYSADARAFDAAGNASAWSAVADGSTGMRGGAAPCRAGACWTAGNPVTGSYKTDASGEFLAATAAHSVDGVTVAHHGAGSMRIQYTANAQTAYVDFTLPGTPQECSAEFRMATDTPSAVFYMGFITTNTSNTEVEPNLPTIANHWAHVSMHPTMVGKFGSGANNRFTIQLKTGGSATVWIDDFEILCG